MRRLSSVGLLVCGAALTLLASCSVDDMSRGAFEGLRRREELQPAPGQDRKELPSYDEYQRSRQRPASGF
jgi:hypothetical protein